MLYRILDRKGTTVYAGSDLARAARYAQKYNLKIDGKLIRPSIFPRSTSCQHQYWVTARNLTCYIDKENCLSSPDRALDAPDWHSLHVKAAEPSWHARVVFCSNPTCEFVKLKEM